MQSEQTNRQQIQYEMERVLRLAAPVILDTRRNGLTRHAKEGTDFATSADLTGQQVMIKCLHDAFPEIPIVAEEDSSHEPWGDKFFTVDPIDGTYMFERGSRHWGCMIGYAEHGNPIGGTIYLPEKDQMISYVAGTNLDVQLNGKRIGQATVDQHHIQLSDAIVCTELGGWMSQKTISRVIVPLTKSSRRISSFGSTAVGVLEFLRGACDAYIVTGGSKIWDIVPAIALVNALGGITTDIHGNPHQLNTVTQSLVCTRDADLHRELIDLLAG